MGVNSFMTNKFKNLTKFPNITSYQGTFPSLDSCCWRGWVWEETEISKVTPLWCPYVPRNIIFVNSHENITRVSHFLSTFPRDLKKPKIHIQGEIISEVYNYQAVTWLVKQNLTKVGLL